MTSPGGRRFRRPYGETVNTGIDTLLRGSKTPLCLGIGGGGDVVGALAVAELTRSFGAEPMVGGVTWERRVVDPLPGPRALAEIEGAQPLNDAVALATAETRGPGGFAFAEARMAEHLGEAVVLADPTPGPRALAAGLADAVRRLERDLVLFVDVGGDVLAEGHEPGLASPLCDAVVLAAGMLLDTVPAAGAVFGPGCDGELTQSEVLGRVAALAAAGHWLGAWGITPEVLARVEPAAAVVPTEASAQALRCARGERGIAEIRGGRRTVELSPLGALTVFFALDRADPATAPLAHAVLDAADLEDANERLHALGVRTELDLEREPPRSP